MPPDTSRARSGPSCESVRARARLRAPDIRRRIAAAIRDPGERAAPRSQPTPVREPAWEDWTAGALRRAPPHAVATPGRDVRGRQAQRQNVAVIRPAYPRTVRPRRRADAPDHKGLARISQTR